MQTTSTNASVLKTVSIPRPSDSDVARARMEKKEKKREKKLQALSKIKNASSERYLRATAVSDLDYLVDRYVRREESSVTNAPNMLTNAKKMLPNKNVSIKNAKT